MFDRGSGPPVIVVPGVQGRWEWMRPTLDALSRRCRTVSYSLSGDFGSGSPMDGSQRFDSYIEQLESIFESTGIDRAVICGVSYGGLIALRFASLRPERVTGLTIVSAPAPGWKPSARQASWIARPWLSAPAFVATGPFRLWPEIRAALPEGPKRLRFALAHGIRVLRAPMIPPLMALRVRQQQELDFRADCERIRTRTLVITGDDNLDTVVPVQVTQRYCELIPSARYVRMDGTGHLGSITQPERFARIVGEFAHANHH
jgi:pimeloyl-ACP methyl ester carboxylesterase